MENYDKEFLEFMKAKYGITLEEATSGHESQIITFAVAWNVWKQAKKIYLRDTSNISKFMSDDHSRLDYLFQEFRKSREAKKSKRLFSEFEAGMKRHISWEEDILFPLTERKLGEGSTMVDELMLQHKRIKSDIKEIFDCFDARDDGLETDLEQLLISHDKMEEEGIYQWIDDCVDDKEKCELIAKMSS